MTCKQFTRLANEYHGLAADVRQAVDALAAGDVAAAADHAGGRFSDAWWAAEFFVRRLAEHGAGDAPRFTPAEPVRQARTLSLFAD